MLINKQKTEHLEKKLDEELLNMELDLEYNKDLLDIFYFGINEDFPKNVLKFWKLLESNISLIPAGMGGVTFRDSNYETLNLFKIFGYDPAIVSQFINDYESRLLKEHHDRVKAEEKKNGTN